MRDYPKPPFPKQQQELPGTFQKMDPKPDHGEESWRGAGTGGDSGIGRAVAIAFAREGADVAMSYLDETDDAQSTAQLVRDAGRECLALPGDISDAAHCRKIVADKFKSDIDGMYAG